MPNFVTPSFDSGFLTSTFSQSRFYHSSEKRDTFRQPQHLLLRLQLLLDPVPYLPSALPLHASLPHKLLFFSLLLERPSRSLVAQINKQPEKRSSCMKSIVFFCAKTLKLDPMLVTMLSH
jgi:hypothetical protein